MDRAVLEPECLPKLVEAIRTMIQAKKDLKSIQKVCEEKNKTIKKGSEKFISSAGLVAKVCYWIGAAGVDRLSRKGKIRQATKNIDDLFAEVCYLSIDPFDPNSFWADT